MRGRVLRPPEAKRRCAGKVSGKYQAYLQGQAARLIRWRLVYSGILSAGMSGLVALIVTIGPLVLLAT